MLHLCALIRCVGRVHLRLPIESEMILEFNLETMATLIWWTEWNGLDYVEMAIIAQFTQQIHCAAGGQGKNQWR